MEYKGYIADLRIDVEAGVLRGRVVNTRDTITFQGTTLDEARHEFRESVDVYLEVCARNGIAPEKPFSGKFPVRTTAALHKALVATAATRGLSLNAYVTRVLTKAVASARYAEAKVPARPTTAAGGPRRPAKRKDARKR